MNSKFLIILLYAFVLTFAFQYFFPGSKNTGTPTTADIVVSIKDDTLTIPNLPLIEILNTTASGLSIAPCDDMSITVNSAPIRDIETVAPEFCQKIDISAGTMKALPFSALAESIAKLPGKYIVSVRTPL